MALRTPNSQRFSFMFAVVEISKRKKDKVRAMKPTTPMKIWNICKLDTIES